MESRLSLKSVLIAVAFFAVTAAMHEAARADSGQGRSPNSWNDAWTSAGSAATQSGTRLRANFLSIPD